MNADTTINPGADNPQPHRIGLIAKRVVLAAIMVVVGVNIWTGAPLFALWVGARVQGDGPTSMTAVAIVAIVLAVVCLILVRILSAVGSSYDRITGVGPTVRTHTPWLRSMSGERERYPGDAPRLTALERILVIMVVVAFIAFEIWFFFFSTSPIDERSGRGEVPSLVAMRS